MSSRTRLTLLLRVFACASSVLLCSVSPGQVRSVRYTDHVPVWAHTLRDLGAVPSSTMLEHLQIVLARSPERETSFQQLLRDQYDPKSPRFHKWLAPEQLGEDYGPDQPTLDYVTNWLRSQDLEVNSVSKSRMIIDFSGTIAALSSAFSTNFHYFNRNGDALVAPTTEPQLPSETAARVRFIAGLSSVPLLPSGEVVDITPDLDCAAGCTHVVSPADFATIYGITAVYAAGTNGAGQTIAAVGFSRVTDSDIEIFQQSAGLPVADPVLRVASGGTDPGPPNLSGSISFLKEATGDVERAFGVAPHAQVILDVTALPTTGEITSLLNGPITDVIDNNVADILTVSFHGCETVAGKPQTLLVDSLFQQAAAEGISVFVGAGDSGVADCAPHGVAPPSSAGPSINYLCASGYVTCVGGTEFADGTDPSLYWAATNSGFLHSALSYIPEGAWNESTQSVLDAGGGGTSLWISKPPWQNGLGVPNSGNRSVPDVAFTAAEHDAYYLCLKESDGTGDCSQHKFVGFAGTSASTPSMAGIMALVNQTLGGRQGNFNPTLYSLAATPSNGVFHDVTVSSSGVSDCAVTFPSLCNNSIELLKGASPPTLSGFSLTLGYDQITGWGSINVANLLAALTGQSSPVPSTTSLSVSSSSISTKQTTTLTVQIFGDLGTPTGTIQILSNGLIHGPAIPIQFGQAILSNLAFPTPGTYQLVAQYSGDARYKPSLSAVSVVDATPPTFSLSGSSGAVFIPSPGSAATSAITVSTTNGFTGTVALSCSVASSQGAQIREEPTCSVGSGGQAILTSEKASTAVTVTINTSAHGTTTVNLRSTRPGDFFGNLVLATGIFMVLAFLRPACCRGGLKNRCILASAVVAVLFEITGCSSSGTPPGSYVLTVTAKSGPASVSTTIEVTVNSSN